MKVPLYNRQGNKKREVVLNPEIYEARVNERLLELVKKAYAANLRKGTADTKVRKEVRGGGKKPWKQKGTGRARHGSIRSPIWKGGGVVFGPHPRDYSVSLPKSMRRQALISALSLRGDQKGLLLVEDLKLQSAKTKEWVEIIKALPLSGKRAVCIVPQIEENLKRASGNLRNLIDVCTAKDISAYDVLQREKLIIAEDALPLIEARLLGEGAHAAASADEGQLTATEEAPARKPAAKKVRREGKSHKAKARTAKAKGKKK